MPAPTRQAVDVAYIGPSWRRKDGTHGRIDAEHPADVPKLSLGWHWAAWARQWLKNDADEPWTYTPEQFRLLLWWGALDEQFRPLYRHGVVQRLKGWG
jgi:hypothetical protein